MVRAAAEHVLTHVGSHLSWTTAWSTTFWNSANWVAVFVFSLATEFLTLFWTCCLRRTSNSLCWSWLKIVLYSAGRLATYVAWTWSDSLRAWIYWSISRSAWASLFVMRMSCFSLVKLALSSVRSLWCSAWREAAVTTGAAAGWAGIGTGATLIGVTGATTGVAAGAVVTEVATRATGATEATDAVGGWTVWTAWAAAAAAAAWAYWRARRSAWSLRLRASSASL